MLRCSGQWACRPHDLGAEHCFIEVQLTVQFPDRVGLGGQVDHRVDALGSLVDVVGEAAPPPDVQLLHAATTGRDDLKKLFKRRLNGAFLESRVEDDHHFVVAHARVLPPLDWRGHGLSVTGGAGSTAAPVACRTFTAWSAYRGAPTVRTVSSRRDAGGRAGHIAAICAAGVSAARGKR